MKPFEVNRILIICLKRFNDNSKKEDSVDIPLMINEKDLKIARKGVKCQYQLYGLIHHSGTLKFGHYVAACHDGHDDVN